MFDWARKKEAPQAALKRRGDAHLDAGEWDAAAACYRDALAVDPGLAEACINLGYVLIQQAAYEPASAALRQALALDRNSADAHFMLGSISLAQGACEAAVAEFERALSLRASFPLAYRELCKALLACGRTEDAQRVLERAIEQEPSAADLRFQLAALHEYKNRIPESIAAYRAGLALDPGNAAAFNQCGLLLLSEGMFDQALDSLDRAIDCRPGYPEALFNRAVVMSRAGKHEQALAGFDRVLSLDPHNLPALFNRGLVLGRLGHPDRELADYDTILRLEPGHAEALRKRGTALRRLGRLAESLASLDAAVKAMPEGASMHCERGLTLVAAGRRTEALGAFSRACQLDPENVEANFNEGMCRLELGDLPAGWQKFEWRWEATALKTVKRNFSQPLWSGKEPLEGKTILLHAEQGYGDTIQFCRYVPEVARRGARVVLEVQAGLESLLKDLSGVHRILVRGQPLPECDFHCPLLTLPLAFNSSLATIPGAVPYLFADSGRSAAWSGKLGRRTRPRVGLVWSGSNVHANDRQRSIPLSSMLGLISDRADFISLQKEIRDPDRQVLEQHGKIAFPGQELSDFRETAALLSNLDLVVSVDTAAAHLAGALGKPLWLLLPHIPDWRWMHDRADSPWYPSARLWRQKAEGDWNSILEEMATELEQWAAVSMANMNQSRNTEDA
jgi:tetratricopeptide (TPR) repeat protein